MYGARRYNNIITPFVINYYYIIIKQLISLHCWVLYALVLLFIFYSVSFFLFYLSVCNSGFTQPRNSSDSCDPLRLPFRHSLDKGVLPDLKYRSRYPGYQGGGNTHVREL